MAKGKRILKAGIKRETGFLYYLSSDLDVFKVKMVRGGEKKKKSDKHILVLKTDLSRDKGFLYYIDKNGDVCSTKMSRGGTARKKKNARKTAARKSSC